MPERIEEKQMKIFLMIVLAQHAIISARAGYITFARGLTSVAAGQDHIGEGNVVKSEPGARFEAALGPYSYVRLRGAATILLESESLESPVVRLLEGAMIIDADDVDDDIPIRFIVDDLTFSVRKNGLYLVERNRVTVLEGELGIDDPSGSVQSNRLRQKWTLAVEGETPALRELTDVGEFEDVPLVEWSRQRSDQLEPRPTFPRRRGGGRRFRF
jgi:hypothetical protein